MIQFICLFCPAIISLLIHKQYFSEKKNDNYINLICHYFLYVLVNTFTMNALLYLLFKRNEIIYTTWFSIKYMLLSSVIALHLPILFNWIKKYSNKLLLKYFGYLKRLGDKANNVKSKILKTKLCKCLTKYYKENATNIKNNFIFIMLVILQFCIFDIVIRNNIFNEIAFYHPCMLTPNILTISYGFVAGIMLVLLPKKLSKILLVPLYLFKLLLFVVNYMMLEIKSEAFTFFNLQIASEGFEYFSFVIEKINFKFIFFLLISIALLILTFVKIKKVNCNIRWYIKLIIFFIGIVTFFALRTFGIAILQDYKTESGWSDITFPKYYTDHLINSRKNVSVLGLYEYTLRDAQNYFQSINETFGSKEEIDSIIKASSIQTEPNEMTGIFKDKNLIMIMMESIDNVIVDEETMPTLYMMMNEGWNFTQRYSPLNSGGSTIATEYTTLSGLFYSYNNKYDVNTYKEAIPSMLNKNNYTVSSFHENNGVYYNRSQLHKSLGFENSYFLQDMTLDKFEYYQDKQFFENDELYNLVVPKNSNQPFMSFIITIAAHGPYLNNWHCENANISTVNDCLRYLSKRTDDMLALMLAKLEEDNLLEDTVIVLYSDHAAYSYNYTKDELANTYEKIDENYNIKNLPFVIYNSEIDAQEYNEIIVNDIDFAPTIFNLFGIDYDARYYVGSDIFSENHKNISIFKDYSWYDGKNYSITTQQDDYFIEISNYVKERLEFSRMLISNDYYKYIKN